MTDVLARVAVSWLLLAGASAFAPPPGQEPALTVTGCVERDAAASTPIYKLVVPRPNESSVIYQLNAPGNAAVPNAVGKTAQVTGTVSIEKRAGREIRVLAVSRFEVVADRCK